MVDAAGATSRLSLTTDGGGPPGTLLDQMLQTFEGLKEDGKSVGRVVINQPLARLKDECNALSQEQMAALQESVQQKSLLSTWSYGSLATTLLYGTATIMGGVYLKWNGEEAKGDPFIRAGALSLANALLSHTGGWATVAKVFSLGNKSVEQFLQTALPLVVTLYTYLWNGRNLSNLSQSNKEKFQMIDRFVQVMNMVLQAGEVYIKFRVGVAESKRVEIDARLNLKNYELTQLLARRGSVNDRFDSMARDIKEIIKGVISTKGDCAKN